MQICDMVMSQQLPETTNEVFLEQGFPWERGAPIGPGFGLPDFRDL